ncbi:MAG TPA: Type 1 glutamine amidotransferase-like domain-containing protein [Pirellulales bacterium]|jgi:peptidase E|nr:Type 1 glutamine amidotransferase-like domain-containing protein [Pirellulales bacterium]
MVADPKTVPGTVSAAAGQIIAIGGAGFSSEINSGQPIDGPDGLLLERYILAQSAKTNPAVCFLPQASGENSDYIARFYTAFGLLPCRPSHLSLFKPHTADLQSLLLEQDVIYVGGGNTRSMLALWREWGLDHVLQRAWQAGAVLAGVSAGSICWFDSGVTDSIPGPLTPMPCLGFLSGSNCPHYDGEVERRPSYHRLLAAGLLPSGLAADDGVGLHFRGTELHRIVSSRPQASAYRVGLQAGPADRTGTVIETRLRPDYLGGPPLGR